MVSPTHDEPNQESSNIVPWENPKIESSESHLDLPPESFWVSKGDENDWLDRNATIERKSSRKLRFFSTPTHHHQGNPVFSGSVFSPSQKATTSLIGFPTGQKSGLPNGNQRQNKVITQGSMIFFRSRSEPGGKSQLQTAEPASPQVSCLGRIGTKRERAKKTGLWRGIVTMLRIRFKAQKMASKPGSSESRTGSIEPELHAHSLSGLSGLKRVETSNFEG